MTDIAGGDSGQRGLMISLEALGGILSVFLVVRFAQRWDSLSLLCVGAVR